jgi:tubulin polyglutamylase TTLL5
MDLFREVYPGLINYSTKGRFIVKFSPKVVYKRCLEAKQLGQKYHLTYKFVKNDTKLIKKLLEGHGFEEIHSSNSLFNLMWTGGGIKPLIFKTLLPFQRVNHFPKLDILFTFFV